MAALERSAERFLGLIAHAVRNGRDAEIGRREQVRGHVHPPAGEIPARGHPEDLAEAVVGVPVSCGGALVMVNE